jgi:hypothetical protein
MSSEPVMLLKTIVSSKQSLLEYLERFDRLSKLLLSMMMIVRFQDR